MSEDNNNLWHPLAGVPVEIPMPPAEPDEEPEEIVSWYISPETLDEEPEEIVSWYVPPKTPDEQPGENGITRRELPSAGSKFDSIREPETPRSVDMWHKAARREKRRRRLALWGSLAACLLIIAGIAAVLRWPKLSADHGRGTGELRPEAGDSASSIVDVTGGDKTSIPRYDKKRGVVRLIIKPQRGDELSAVEIYQKVNPSVVTVVTETDTGSSVGTGVIMTPDGYIITNAHVISGGRKCWVALDSGASLDAMLVGYDEDEDLAVLKAVAAKNLPPAEFGDSETLQVGERVYAIGNPLGIELRGTMTDGIISAVNRQVEVGDGRMTMIQTTAALNNGNSGGPLINSSGQIVGINTLKMGGSGWSGEATVEGLGFALPISSVSFVVNDLIATGEFRGVPTIGISVITAMDDQGGTRVEVYSVEENMGAAAAGVKAGDIILAADGTDVHTVDDLQVVRRNHAIGDTVTLTILRDGKTMDIDVVLYSNKNK